jgi:hypothetical protein
MIDVDTFVTTLYVMVDDFCKVRDCQPEARPGPQASLSVSNCKNSRLDQPGYHYSS